MSPRMSDGMIEQTKAFVQGLDHDDLPPCIYCNAPWFVFSLDPEHKDGCPMVTEIYPVLPVDLAHEDGFACGKCNTPFKLGDLYKAVSQPDEEDIYVAVCLPCLNY